MNATPDLPQRFAASAEPSRRAFLGYGGLIATSVLAGAALAGCSTPSAASKAASFGTPLPAFPDTKWNPKAKSAGKKPNLPKRIAFQNVAVGSTALDAVDKWMRTAANEIGFDYISSNSNGNPGQTISQMQAAIARGVMGLLTPGDNQDADAAAMRPGLDKGTATFLFNDGGVTCGMAAVQYDFGYSQGSAAAAHIKDALHGEAQIVYINGNANITLRPRETGFKDALQAAGIDLAMYTSIAAPAAGTQKAGSDIMSSVLQTKPNVNVVAGVSDDIALGALGALKTAGKWTATPGLFVCGADGSAEALSYIQQGNTPYKATGAAHFPMAGYVPGRLTERWAQGLTIPQFLEYNSFKIDSPEAAAEFLADQDKCHDLYQQMLDGDTKYITPRGEISYETHNSYYSGKLLEKLPAVKS